MVFKEDLEIHSWRLNITSVKRGGGESTSEVFKTREGAEEWLEKYKKNQLKLEDVFYVVKTKTEKIDILMLLKDECIVNYFGLGKNFQCFSMTSNGKIDCLSKDSISDWKIGVDKKTFLKILKENNLLK